MILNDVANNETWQNCKYTKSLPNPIANISTHTLSRPHTFSPAYSHIPTHSPIWLRNKRAPVNRTCDCRQLTISAGRITVRKLKNIKKNAVFIVFRMCNNRAQKYLWNENTLTQHSWCNFCAVSMQVCIFYFDCAARVHSIVNKQCWLEYLKTILLCFV